jgi:peptide/nickel transport system permease protein
MSQFIIRRLLLVIPVLLGVSIVVFGIMHLSPGDPARIMLGAGASHEDVVRVRQEFGLDQPIYVQYWNWMSGVLQGDMGRSISLHRPVLGEVLMRFQNTVLLTSVAIVISFSLGIAMGVISAVKRGSLFDRLLILTATIGLSLPAFWFAMMLIILFSVNLQLLPGTGMTSSIGGGGVLDVAKHMILPALALSVVPMAVVARYTRSTVLEVIAQDYVNTARAKGLRERVIVMRHVLRNAMVVIVTMLGLQIGFMLAGAVYIENVFSWPGLGHLLVEAILRRDYPLVQGGVLVVATSYVFVNLLTDIAYGYLDPRIRLS